MLTKACERNLWETLQMAAAPDRIENNPPAPALLGDVWRVRIFGKQEGQMTVNNLYYQDDGDGPGAGTIDAAGELYSAVTAPGGIKEKYTACCSAQWLWDKITIDCPTTPTLSTQEVTIGGTGGGAAGPSPTFVTVVLQKRTLTKGKCGRGWIGIPAVPVVSYVESSLIDKTPYQALADALRVRLTQGVFHFDPGIYSLGTKKHPQQGFAVMTKCLVRTLLGTVRRRFVGRGK